MVMGISTLTKLPPIFTSCFKMTPGANSFIFVLNCKASLDNKFSIKEFLKHLRFIIKNYKNNFFYKNFKLSIIDKLLTIFHKLLPSSNLFTKIYNEYCAKFSYVLIDFIYRIGIYTFITNV